MKGIIIFKQNVPIFLKKQNISYVLTLLDDELEDTSKFEAYVKALFSNISSDTSSVEISEYNVFTNNVDNFSQYVCEIHPIKPYSTNGNMIKRC